MKALCLSAVLLAASTTHAFELTSQDIQEGHPMAKTFEYNGWGCDGDNMSPHLAWQDIPQGTKSFAITAYDPDAPTGSGFWHWIAFDLPADINELPRNADLTELGATQARNDYGEVDFGGACPPVGDGMHRYQFTVWALPEASLNLDATTPAAVVGFNLNAKALGKAKLTTTFTR